MDRIRGQTPFGRTHDRLLEFIGSGGDISSSVYSRYARLLPFVYDDVSGSIFFGIECIDDGSIRLISDGHEYSFYRELASICKNEFLYTESSLDRGNSGFEVHVDIGVLGNLIDPNRLSTEFFSADEDMYLFADFGKVESLGDRSIPSADKRYGTIAEKHPVAGGTVGYSGSEELLFSGDSEFFILVTDGKEYGFGFQSFS